LNIYNKKQELMNLTVLNHMEEAKLRMKVGDLELFKSKILNTKINLSEFEIYKDAFSRDKAIYIALKHNPKLHVKATGVSIS
jgi:hypothetical protein